MYGLARYPHLFNLLRWLIFGFSPSRFLIFGNCLLSSQISLSSCLLSGQLRRFFLNAFLFTLGLFSCLVFLNRLLSSQISFSSCLLSGQLRGFLLPAFLVTLSLFCCLIFRVSHCLPPPNIR